MTKCYCDKCGNIIRSSCAIEHARVDTSSETIRLELCKSCLIDLGVMIKKWLRETQPL